MSYERYDGWGDGAYDSIKKKLILSIPDVISRIGADCVGLSYCCWWTRVGSIDVAKKVIANEESVKLEFLGKVIG